MKLCGFDVGPEQPLFLIAGPCVIESRQMAFDTAGELKALCAALAIPFIYKSSFDKANRSSGRSPRGPGMDEGLAILAEVREKVGVPVLTDVHEVSQIAAGGRCLADASVPVPADGFHRGRGLLRQAGQYQEGAVSSAGRHAAGRCQGQGG